MTKYPETIPGRLKMLADWLDIRFYRENDEVQQDLRRWSVGIERLFAAIESEDMDDIWAAYVELKSQPEKAA